MLSIVCPFYNEKENLRELQERLLNTCRGIGGEWEIVFVDDGSTDGGAEFLKTLAAPEVRLIRLERNRGLSTALYAGLQAARGEVIATLDADLQNPPEEIPRLLAQLEGSAMVTGIRQTRRDNLVRRVSSGIANTVRRSVLGDTITDIGCSLRVFRREALRAYYPYAGMHRFFPAVAQAHGLAVKQTAVRHEPRRRGKAKYGLSNRLLGPLWDLCAVKWLLTRRIHYQVREDSR